MIDQPMNEHDPMTNYDRALAYAHAAHAGQLRKGTSTPYISHPIAVAELVRQHGGTQTEAIAALLHDTVEDQGGRARLDDIEQRFGARVAQIVAACSEWIEEPHQTSADKPSWDERKRAAITRLEAETDESVLRVALADKLHNARSIVADLEVHGPQMLTRFNAPPDELLWYYRRLVDAFRGKGLEELHQEFEAAVTRMDVAAHEGACPRCGETVKPVPIAYGYPSAEMFEAAERGEIQLGGCVIGEDDPPFVCPACGQPIVPALGGERG
jgi:predicted RNA-binding Zn-ribbon protein involved in translation (DUF1610 family)